MVFPKICMQTFIFSQEASSQYSTCSCITNGRVNTKDMEQRKTLQAPANFCRDRLHVKITLENEWILTGWPEGMYKYLMFSHAR